MAWQNSAAMVGNGGGSSGPSEAGGSNGQTQGTEYTLQGMAFTCATKSFQGHSIVLPSQPKANISNSDRGHAISTNRMAPARERPECLANRAGGDEVTYRQARR